MGKSNCDKCGVSFIGDPIPEEDLQHFSRTHWSANLVGIDGGRMGIYDGLIAWRCTSCNHEWACGDSEWALELFKKYKELDHE